jgi:hypothetical protein
LHGARKHDDKDVDPSVKTAPELFFDVNVTVPFGVMPRLLIPEILTVAVNVTDWPNVVEAGVTASAVVVLKMVAACAGTADAIAAAVVAVAMTAASRRRRRGPAECSPVR